MNTSGYAASPAEGKEILRILESSAAKGSIELIYTRRPDAYESYIKDCKDARVFVSRHGDRVIGTCAELIREVYIDGEVCRCGYLCGLKKDAKHTGGVGFGPGFIKDLPQEGVEFYYCSVVAENGEVRRMFEKSSRLLSMKPLTGYKTYIVNPKVKIKAPCHSFTFRRAQRGDGAGLLAFLNGEGKKKDLFPVFRDLHGFHGLDVTDFYLLLEGESIVATAALWNQTDYKQYVVKRYGGLMKLARVCNPLLSALGYIKLPQEDQPLDFPMLSFFLCKDDREDLYRIFLKAVTEEIAKDYGLFVIGLPDGHFAKPLLDALPSISFKTELYGVEFPRSGQRYKTPDPKKLFPECGLL